MGLHPVLLDAAHKEVLLESVAGSATEHLGQTAIKIVGTRLEV